MEKDFTTNSKLSLKNKNILITGAGKGTGYELLKDFDRLNETILRIIS